VTKHRTPITRKEAMVQSCCVHVFFRSRRSQNRLRERKSFSIIFASRGKERRVRMEEVMLYSASVFVCPVTSVSTRVADAVSTAAAGGQKETSPESTAAAPLLSYSGSSSTAVASTAVVRISVPPTGAPP
jgi:hypothetical protein